jgi:inhibitor of KinA sporulation pathway (predicted exonuclease)
MAIRKDKILVMDLEATCWEGFDAPEGQENEIIEIGVCLLDHHTGDITQKRSLLVQPTRSEISPFCTQLTTITPELVAEEGMSFPEACTILERDYDSRNRLWGSWGSFDRRFFLQQCKQRDVRYPFSKKHANLKRVFADHFGKRMGMARALDVTGLGFEGQHHRGHDDAYNTARILRLLIEEHGSHILRRYGL